MLVVHVSVEVKSEYIAEFIEATLDNAAHSIEEPGIARFDVVQDRERPELFTLVEAYYSDDDPGRHKETDHYLRWRDRVEPMMARPRSSTKNNNLFPQDDAW